MKKDSYSVYAHITPNGKYYVGITRKNPNIRWKYGKGYKTQIFGRAVKKYGWENIFHEVIASNLTRDEACAFERLLISKLKSNLQEFGYNRSAGGDGNSSPQSDEQKERIRLRMLGSKRPHSEETKLKIGAANKGKCIKAIKQYSRSGEFLNEFESLTAASRATGISLSNIGEVANGNRKTAGGCLWKYKEEKSGNK